MSNGSGKPGVNSTSLRVKNWHPLEGFLQTYPHITSIHTHSIVISISGRFILTFTLPETNSSPLKMMVSPMGISEIPGAGRFSGVKLAVSFFGRIADVYYPKNPDPSRSKRIFRVPIPSEKTRNGSG